MKGLRALSALLAAAALLVAAPLAAAAEGHLDTEFGSGGIRYLPASLREPRGLALLGDGRVAYANGTEVAVLLPSGELDPGFGDAGLAAPALPTEGEERISTIATDPQGRLVIVGSAESKSFVERLTPAGQPDPTFGAGSGYVLGDFGPPPPKGLKRNEYLQNVDFDSAGHILVSGEAVNGTQLVPKAGELTEPSYKPFVARLDEAGNLESTFGSAKVYKLTGSERPLDGRIGPLLDPEGRTITWSGLEGVEHKRPNGFLIKRLLPSGAPDPTFGKHGSVELRVPRFYEGEVGLDEQGRVLVAASFKGRSPVSESKELGLIRLEANGRIDKSFGKEGVVYIRFPGESHGATVYLETLSVRGDQAAINASYCGHCNPVIALVDLGAPEASASSATATASSATASAAPTRGQIAEESGFERLASGGWRAGECHITRIFTSKAEVLVAEKRAERQEARHPETGGFVIGFDHERIGVELPPRFGYCQEAIEDDLAHVGHGGVPEGAPTTVANARAAIEALGYPIHLEEPAGEPGVIVGRVHGSLGERFAFFLFVNRGPPKKMPGVPGYPGFGPPAGLAGGTLVEKEGEEGHYAFGSRETPRRGETKAQFKQQSKIQFDVEEALCEQATGEGCGI
jgi:uncharacterized delta-60 repeat protein